MPTRKTKRKKARGNQGRTLEPERVALILSVAAKDGATAAAKQFGVADRTIGRWKAKVESGNWPEVTELVANLRREAADRCADLLTEAYEVSLRRIVELAPSSTIEQAIRAGEMCGQLKVTRDALSEPGSTNQSGPEST